ncbi:MAG: T9SS type A sorting domain-containing protein [Saprospiraceae bacterium]|nr:T9SS type A sorting domain-containing protein [Saprospiraceae bacterium]
MKKTSFPFLFVLFSLLPGFGLLHAQENGCSNITFTAQNIGPCHYRLLVVNSSTCYPEIHLRLDTGGFLSWTALTQNGWSGELISPTDLILTHSSGHIPLGASTPVDFYLVPGADPVLTILWEYTCSFGKSCFFETPLTSCTSIPGGCISGVNYVDVSCANQPYSNQPTLAGWTITLLDAMGNTVESTQTNANGAYSFCDLLPGVYVVKKTNQPGWTSSVPASGQSTVVLSQSAQVVRNFGSCRANCLCSSIQTTVQQITTSPTACCYSLSTTTFGSGDYCFQYINVQVDAGLTITPSSTQTGWTTVQNGPQSITITPPNGFVPNGSVTPVTFCVSGGTSHSILVTAGYNDSAGAHECDNFLSFSCPNCNCPPPTGLAVSNLGEGTATIGWTPADCSESTWVYVEDGFSPAEHISRPSPVDSIVLDGLVPGALYQVYAFSMCGGVMSESSDTIRYYLPCPGECLGSVSNGSFNEPYTPNLTVPNAQDQIGLCPGWQATANGSSASGIGEWFMYGSPLNFPTVFPGSYYDAVNNQYTILGPYCGSWYAGFDLNTCEGISTQLTSPIAQLNGYTLGFWWALREPVTSNFSFQAILSGSACTMNTTNGGTICTRQCGSDISIPVQVTTSHQPGVWYFHSVTATASVAVSHLTFAASASGPTVGNYVYIDEVCLRSLWLPCDPGKPRIAQNPEQPNTFSGETDLGAGSTLVSAVWDFGDGTRDSSCCLGSIVHDFAPGTYNVCLTVTAIDTSGSICSNSSCIQVVVPEVTDPCDDVTASLQSTGIGNCCYNLNISNAAANFFTGINIILSSGDFVNSQFGAGWNITLNGNVASLTPASGSFIPVGTDIPVTICDPGGTDPYTVTVVFTYEGENCIKTLVLDCDCSCGTYDLEIRLGGAQNQPIVCGQTIPLGLNQGFSVYSKFQCQGANCEPSELVSWSLTGPNLSIGSSDLATPNFTITALSPGSFSTPGLYTLNMYAICGLQDTCWCTLYFDVADPCCTDQATFLANAAAVQTNGILGDCFIGMQAVGLSDCMRITYDWGDNNTSGPITGDNIPVTHTYASAGNYTVCYTIEEIDFFGNACWSYQSCEQVTVLCNSCCSGGDDLDIIVNLYVSVSVDDTPCSATINIGDLPACFYLDSINWGDGNISFGPYGAASSILHTYESEGPYTITYTGVKGEQGSGAVCVQKSFSKTVDPVCFSVCPCLGFSNMIFSPGPGGGPQSVSCGTDVILPCQPGVTYTLTGTLPCLGTGVCQGIGAVSWQLFGPQGLVDAGTTTASPGFSIPLPSGYFYVTGTYALIINGQCGSTPCPCTIYFVVNPPCPPLCPCDVADFQADVLAGFSTTYYTFFNCKACFKGVALGPCDMVEWSVNNGPFSAPIPGNQFYCFPFSGNGTYSVEMRVTRKKGVNLICEVFSFTKTITVNCKPIPIVIGGPRMFDPFSHVPALPLKPDAETTFRVMDTGSPGEKTTLRIFPNPNTGAFSVELSEAADAGMQFRILGLTGRVLLEQSVQTGSKLQTVQTGDLPGGLYFLQVVTDGKVIAVERFVKQ